MGPNTITLSAYLVYYFLVNPQINYCTPGFRFVAKCNPYFIEPVCALYYGEDCKSKTGFCKKDFNNYCLACIDASVIAAVPGKCCHNKPSKCGDQSNVKCNGDEGESVCAIVQQDQQLEPFSQTFVNSCVACSSSDTLFYTEGSCPDESTLCKPEQRNADSCTMQNDPKCAYYKQGNKVLRKTMRNACVACGDPNVIFYAPQACEEDVFPN